MSGKRRPVVVITGAAGNIGSAIARALADDYDVVGFDLSGSEPPCDFIPVDVTSAESVETGFALLREHYGTRIASFIHLAAFFDFTGEDNPLYDTVNVEGTRHLLRGLQGFEVEQFIYSGTMLVHRPGAPGEPITEETPIEPKWAYPISKAETEAVIQEERGDVPVLVFHLAGLYSEEAGVPTLTHQIARIYERDIKSRFYPAAPEVGQSFIHQKDLIDLLRRAVDRRDTLPNNTTILAGEPDAMGYQALQDELGRLIHGEESWQTVHVPKEMAAAFAWLEEKAEPVIPDALDQGEKPFIRPFMIRMADDHYELDISCAKELLDWEPAHSIRDTLPDMVEALKEDPAGWYRRNGITLPPWMETADARPENPETVRQQHETEYRRAHRNSLWAHFANMGLGAWLIASPPTLGYPGPEMVWSDIGSGILLILLSGLSLSWRLGPVRWATAALGMWVMFAPLVFWSPSAAAYLNGTLVGALMIGFSILVRPPPGVSPVAATTGPTVPPGWEFSPSSWFQRAPIIFLAVIGLLVSRDLGAYQLGHIDGVWEPFFGGGPSPKNGTEEIITSSVSEAWPVPDAALGGLVYMLEILTGLLGSTRRWRTMPWLVMLFGFLIVPLGAVSITFIIIQPIVIGTWCTLCLIQAAAMLIQIPYSLDELAATGQFLVRRKKAGQPLLRVFLFGDTDEGKTKREEDDFSRSPGTLFREVLGGGVSVPWNLALCFFIGVWLMCTRLTLDVDGTIANADHLIGALVITMTVTALAEVGRLARYGNLVLGLCLLPVPFILDAGVASTVSSLLCGLGLVLLSLPRSRRRYEYGSFNRFVR